MDEHVAENLDKDLYEGLKALVLEDVGSETVILLRGGFSEVTSEGNFSVTVMAVTDAFVAIGELRVRSRAQQEPVVQTFMRDRIRQVARTGEKIYMVFDAPPSDLTNIGFVIEGPVVSLPDGTRAHEVLPAKKTV
jgi:hypothetical protein